MSRDGTHILLSDTAAAAALIAVIEPDLAATQIRFTAEGGRAPHITVQISVADQASGQAMAETLQLDYQEASHAAPAWSGIYPLTEAAARPLHVHLTVAAKPLGQTLTLQEACAFLDLLAGVVLTDVPIAAVHLHAHAAAGGSVEIHTADPRSAQTLRLELAGVLLPMQPIVLAPAGPRPSPPSARTAP